MKIPRKMIFFQVVFFAICFNNFAHTQSVTDIVSKFEKRVHTFQNTTLPYRIFIPESYDSTQTYPLMLCLHGAGERGTDNENHIKVHGMATSWADTSNQSERPCFVVAPQCPLDNKWVDVDWTIGTYSLDNVPISNELQTVINLLDSLLNEFNIDPNRQYVTGLSMGGYGTWDLIGRYPERFAAAIPMSGAGDTSKVEQFRDVPVWNFHGALDNVVPVSGAKDMLEAMSNSEIEVIQTKYYPDSVIDIYIANDVKHFYTEYESGYHVIWQESYEYLKLHKWVFSQALNTTSINDNTVFLEKVFILEQNYPNPFNPSTTITFSLSENGFVSLDVFNSVGQLIETLESTFLTVGTYKYAWYANNHSSGIYFYRLETLNFLSTRKMLLIR